MPVGKILWMVSFQALEALEKIDREVRDGTGVTLVKTSDREEAEDYGLPADKLPSLVLFENAVPHVYPGDVSDGPAVAEWLAVQAHQDSIEEVGPAMLDRLVRDSQAGDHAAVAALVYFRSAAHDLRILAELESIDGRLEGDDVHLVKLAADDGGGAAFAERHGVDVIPSLVLFGGKGVGGRVFKGDLGVEEEVLSWVKKELGLH